MKTMKYSEKQKIDWILMNLRLSGSPISEETAADIAAGGFAMDAPLEYHLLIGRLLDVLHLMEVSAKENRELSCGLLGEFYRTVSGGAEPFYRKSTPVLFHLSYNPVLPQEVEEELSSLFRKLNDEAVYEPLSQAAWIHNELIRIYPYDEFSEIIARAAMEYELLYSGKPMCSLTLQETEYNCALTEYLKGRGGDKILENLRLNELMGEQIREKNTFQI